MKPDLSHALQLAVGEDAAARVFDYARAGVTAIAPSGLTTASVYDLPNMRTRRVFSENLDAYGTGNFKRVDRNVYYDTVILGQRPFVSNTVAEFAAAFFDWQKIEDLGFSANMNIPAIADGRVIGTMNLLSTAGTYAPEVVAGAMEWQPVVTLAFLLLHLEGAEHATFHGKGASIDLTPNLEGL
ncbi:hypothetical protein [Ketogulonicigenium vulgare]|uniref:hypothetical protein n=1 Tax=Ketogulonicigenium vulgare TaxID=92945 RepID=UPI0023593A2C|nr:hypothetical protein [Ketogulonicigenium vulgare]